MIKIDFTNDNRMFRRAWYGHIIPKYTMEVAETWNTAESREVWYREFGCIMKANEVLKFVEAEWEDESLCTAFLLRWAR